ncbi:MAG: CHAT domain-containing protein, partial [Magnetococcus sp. DMHC-8]
MSMRFHLANQEIIFNQGDGRMVLRPAQLAAFQAWARRYDKALANDRDASAFFTLGQEIFAWLDEQGWLSHALQHGEGALEMEFSVSQNPDELGRAFLHVPWELLAGPAGYLARDSGRPFIPVRRLGDPHTPWQPRHGDMHLVFMAAAPRQVSTLDYEKEESGILEQTSRLPLALTVEESGSLPLLGEVVSQLPAPPEAIHISCHGDIKNHQPFLILEDEAGNRHDVTAGDLAEELGRSSLPPLLFLSACRTAEGREEPASLAMEMVRCGCANVVGWDSSVYDQDASAFAGHFYKALASHATVKRATASARRALLQEHERNPERFRHWHLARLLIGPAGGGAVCLAGQGKRPIPRDAGAREFLDKNQVPVATRAHFVGRRRAIQQIIAAFRTGDRWGAVVHGMGCVGKSSLAARIANRLASHQTVLVFEKYDAVAVFDAILDKWPGRHRADLRDAWREKVQHPRQGAQHLGDALREILATPLDNPLLLIIDDLEQILLPADGQRPATPFQTPFQPVMRAILEAFRDVPTAARILFTSRYRFTLTATNGRELAEGLLDLPLSPLSEQERHKQWGAESRHADVTTLVIRILRASQGNPGLQNLLTRPVLQGRVADANEAVDKVETFLAHGTVPQDTDVGDFFRRMTLESYVKALTPAQKKAFRAVTLFQLPAPRPAVAAVLRAVSDPDPSETCHRLLGLGLFNRYESGHNDQEHLGTEPLARPLFPPPLTPDEEKKLAQAALPPLLAAWREGDGRLPWNPLSLEAFRLAQLAGAGAAMEEAAIEAGFWLFKRKHDARTPLTMVQQTLAVLAAAQLSPSPRLLHLGAQCAARLGEAETRRTLLARGMAMPQEDTVEWAELWGEYAVMLAMAGDPTAAQQWLSRAAQVFQQHGDIHSRAITLGKIADILFQQGQLDEAMRIRREEQLPVYNQLGD